jgi:hypothetical protein
MLSFVLDTGQIPQLPRGTLRGQVVDAAGAPQRDLAASGIARSTPVGATEQMFHSGSLAIQHQVKLAPRHPHSSSALVET